MTTDVAPADAVTAPEAQNPETSTNYADVVKSFTPEERHQWALTGEEPERIKNPTPPKEKAETIAPVKAKTPDPGSGSEDEDHEPDYVGTPDQIKAQKRAFARQRQQLAEAKAELKLLREQKAEKTPAPAAVKTEETKPAEAVRPKRPRMTDPKYAVDGGAAQYDADMDTYEDAKQAFDRQEWAKEGQKTKAEVETHLTEREKSQRWAGEVEAAKGVHPDFEAVAFNPKIPISYTMLMLLPKTEGGAEVMYHLGSHPEECTALAEATEIPGFKSAQELSAAAEKDPALARKLGAAEAMVQAEIKRIQAGPKKEEPHPKPITKTKAPAPATRVNANTQATGDPVEDAYARGDFALGAKLESQREVERHIRR